MNITVPLWRSQGQSLTEDNLSKLATLGILGQATENDEPASRRRRYPRAMRDLSDSQRERFMQILDHLSRDRNNVNTQTSNNTPSGNQKAQADGASKWSQPRYSSLKYEQSTGMGYEDIDKLHGPRRKVAMNAWLNNFDDIKFLVEDHNEAPDRNKEALQFDYPETHPPKRSAKGENGDEIQYNGCCVASHLDGRCEQGMGCIYRFVNMLPGRWSEASARWLRKWGRQ